MAHIRGELMRKMNRDRAISFWKQVADEEPINFTIAIDNKEMAIEIEKRAKILGYPSVQEYMVSLATIDLCREIVPECIRAEIKKYNGNECYPISSVADNLGVEKDVAFEILQKSINL